MLDHRVPGRPPKGNSEVGRAKIINELQSMLRVGDCGDLSRKSVARRIGITPALITYYFPKNTSLIQQATQPVLERYHLELQMLVKSDLDLHSKTHAIITLLIRVFTQDGDIFKAYSDFIGSEGQKQTPDLIDLLHGDLNEFFATEVSHGWGSLFGPELLSSAVWGMCEHLGRSIRMRSPAGGGDLEPAALSAAIAERVLRLIVEGLPLAGDGERRPQSGLANHIPGHIPVGVKPGSLAAGVGLAEPCHA